MVMSMQAPSRHRSRQAVNTRETRLRYLQIVRTRGLVAHRYTPRC